MNTLLTQNHINREIDKFTDLIYEIGTSLNLNINNATRVALTDMVTKANQIDVENLALHPYVALRQIAAQHSDVVTHIKDENIQTGLFYWKYVR